MVSVGRFELTITTLKGSCPYLLDDTLIIRRFRLCSKPYKAHVKDLPWYAYVRGVVGTLGRTPRSDLRPLTKRIVYSYAFQLTPTRLSAYGRCNYTDHRFASVGSPRQEEWCGLQHHCSCSPHTGLHHAP